jgi:hypothetical protein
VSPLSPAAPRPWVARWRRRSPRPAPDIVPLDLDADGDEAAAAALRGLGRRVMPISGGVSDNSMGR